MVTALFDGHCVICQGTRKTFKALDWLKRVEFLDLHQHETVQARYPGLDHNQMMGEIHVVTDDGIFAGFNGTRRMMREIPLLFPIWLILQLPGMAWVGSRVYKLIAKNRYAVNRLFGVELDESCVDGVCKI